MRRFRKWWVRAVVAMGALLLLALGLYAARGPLFERLAAERLQAVLSKRLGATVTIASLSGDWLTGVTLHGLRLRGGQVLQELDAGEFEFEQGLWELLRSQPDPQKQVRIRAERALVVLPQPSDASYADAAWRAQAVQTIRDASRGNWLGGLSVDIKDCEVRGRDSFALRGPLQVQVPARAVGAALLAQLKTPALQLDLSSEPEGLVSLHARSAQAEQVASLFVTVPDFTAGAIDLQLESRPGSPAIVVRGSAREVAVAGRTAQAVELRGNLAEQGFTIENLEVSSDRVEATLRDYRAEFANGLAGRGEITMDASSLAPLLELRSPELVASKSWSAMRSVLNGLEGSLTFGLFEQQLHLQPASLRSPLGSVQVVAGVVPLRPDQLTALQFTTVLEYEPLAPPSWLEPLPLRPISGTVRTQCTWAEDALQLRGNVDLAMQDQDGLSGALAGSFALPLADRWQVQAELLLQGAMLRGLAATSVVGTVDFSPSVPGAAVMLLPLKLQVAGQGTIELRGELQPDVDWRQSLRNSSLTAQFTDVQLGSLLASLAPDATSSWLTPMLSAKLNGSVRLGSTGHAELQVQWADLPVVGATAATLTIDAAADGLVLRDCELTTAIGQTQLEATLPDVAWSDLLADPAALWRAKLSASAQYRSRPLQELLVADPTLGLRGSLTLSGELQGSLSAPSVLLQVRDSDAELDAFDVHWSHPIGTMRFVDGVFRLTEVGVSAGQAQLMFGGEVAVGKVGSGAASWQGQLKGSLAQLPNNLPDTEVELQFAWQEQRLLLSTLHAQSEALQLHGKGLAIDVGRDVLLAAASSGDMSMVLNAALHGELQVVSGDLSRLPGLSSRGIAGRAVADIALAGTLREPDPTVTLQVDGGSVRILEGPRIDDVSARIVATAQGLDCKQLTATVAGGAVRVSGTFAAPDEPLWRAMQTGQLDLKIDGKDVLLRRRNGVKIRSDLDLTAKGPLAHIDLKGNLGTQATKVVGRLPYFTLNNVGGADTARGLELVGPDLGEHVRVYLDLAVTSAQPIVIATNVIAGEVTSALTVKGTLEQPRLAGTLAMPSGTITFPGCTFRTSNALLQFDREDSAFPELSLSAMGRRHGYDVRMVVRGPYNAPEIQLSSTPPLPAQQLAVLVTTGARPDNLQGGRAVGALLGSYLVQELADYLFGSESTEAKESFVSRFEVETGTEISTNGTESIVVNFRVADHVFLQGERDVYEDVNLGVVYRIRFE